MEDKRQHLLLFNMEKEELKDILYSCIDDDNVGMFIYFTLKDDMHSLRKANMPVDLTSGIIEDFKKRMSPIVEKLSDDEFSVLDLSNADDRNNAIFHYDLGEDNMPANFNQMKLAFENAERDNIQIFSHNDIENIDGIILVLGIHGSPYLSTYVKHYPINTFNIGKGIFSVSNRDDQFSKIENPMIRLDGRFDYFYVNNEFFVTTLNVLEKFDDIKTVIINEATLGIADIEQVRILEDTQDLNDRIRNDVTFARKFLKVIRHSKVKSKTAEEIRQFVEQKVPNLNHILVFTEESKLILDTRKKQNAFLDLLNDDFLKSELTGQGYKSKAKDEF